MSRILSALRKSESRRADAAPAHPQPALLAKTPADGRRTRIWIPVALTGIAVFGATALLYYRTEEIAADITAMAEAPPDSSLRSSRNQTAPAADPWASAEWANLHIDVLVYAKKPSSRFVLVNMQRFGEGELIAPETRLEEITASGVIVSHRGRRLHLAPRPP